MNYCRRCVLPDTRPNLVLDDAGICSACRSFAARPGVDWEARREAFVEVVATVKRKQAGYDCLIPVSGGKDSTWQVVTCLEYGLKPLCVTWRTPGRTVLGQENLDNLMRLGVDHLDYTISPEVERRFMRKALERFGSSAIPMHMAIFSIPPRLAVAFDIPLIVWAENSAFEYGNAADVGTGFRLDGEWLRKYGVTHGTSAKDWIDEDLSESDLAAYLAPSEAELAKADVKAIFLGYYLEWDVETTRDVAVAHGFKTGCGSAKTGIYDYADLDCDFISVHHWFKWFKFGFTRSWDNLSIEIRQGRITREEAIAKLHELGDERPSTDIAKLCEFLGYSDAEFRAIEEQFRNDNVWCRDNGAWKIRDFLIENWSWQ